MRATAALHATARRASIPSVGGPDPVRARHFRVVDDQDLGDEGRLPPPLHGVGGKLKPGALRSILSGDRLHVRRDFMEVRMPGFPAGAAERLADALEAVDALPGDLDEPPLSATATEDGLELIGTGGMGCVTCHDIHVHPAPGISTIDLATAYDRLRPGWVERFLRDPAAIRPGTRMPAYWPEGQEIVTGPEHTWSVDETIEVSLSSEADLAPIVRDSQGVRQLLQRIQLEPHATLELDVTLSW